ncbi:MAG TPA: hypothetical protein VNA19_02085 [Pyrinomonadaceae bacterium]|nr:hypothetical protein [Pyrinomonadaceae bacterium]
MITGFNTDIEYAGVTYHIQTEDKGLETPLILSLVYVGGAILASKRTNYQDLIDAGFDQPQLIERLQRQHKLICAAVRAGRIEELKKMNERDAPARAPAPAAVAPSVEPKTPQTPPPVEAKTATPVEAKTTPPVKARPASPVETRPTPPVETKPAPPIKAAPPVAVKPPASPPPAAVQRETIAEPPRARVEPAREPAAAPPPRVPSSAPPANQLDITTLSDHDPFIEYRPVLPPTPPPATNAPEVVETPKPAPPPSTPPGVANAARAAGTTDEEENTFYIRLLDDEGEFRAGELVMIRVHVGRGRYGNIPVRDAAVTVKVLGTTFRPLIVSTETDEEGVAIVRALLPRFTSGRAAILIRARADGYEAEMRRIIKQA